MSSFPVVSRSLRARRILAVALILAPSWVRSAETSPAPASEIVELPSFVVTEMRELPPPESWRYVEVPGYEIISSLSARETRRFVRDFQLLQQAIGVVWPALAQVRQGQPAMIILCNRDDEFDRFVPEDRRDPVDIPTSVFVNDDERSGIVVDFIRRPPPFEDVGGSAEDSEDTAIAEAEFMSETDPYREFYLQYFRAMIRRGMSQPPRWLEEGLVQLLASMNFSERSVEVGRIGEGGDLDFTTRLQRAGLLPFADLFSNERPERFEERTYSAQCYAFVHLGLFGDNHRYQPAFQKLVAQALRGPITEEIFKECFGLTYKQMGIVIRGYTQFTSYKSPQYRAKKGSAGFEVNDVEPRAATQAEVGRLQGEVYRLSGYPDRARLALIAPYVRGERDPRLLAALGLHELSTGQTARARTFLEAAAAGKVERPRAWLELARLRLAEYKLATGETAAPLNEDQFNKVLDPLLMARSQRPALPEVYEEIGFLWADATRPPGPEDLRVIYEGALTFPTRMRLIYTAASLAVAYGQPSDARALVEHGLTYASAGAKPHFEQLRAKLPPAPAPAPK